MMLYNNSNPDCAKLPANSTSMEVCIDEPRALVVHPHKVRIILLLRESSYYSETLCQAYIKIKKLIYLTLFTSAILLMTFYEKAQCVSVLSS